MYYQYPPDLYFPITEEAEAFTTEPQEQFDIDRLYASTLDKFTVFMYKFLSKKIFAPI